MDFIKNTLSVGAQKPFVILHVSDIHLSEADENESERRREFAAKRKRYFAFAPEAVEKIKEYVKKTGYPLINTGDMLDFITPENLRLARIFREETDMMMAAGNHEYWHCFNDRFSYDDVEETYKGRRQALDMVSEAIGTDVRFSVREINGVKLVCMDNSAYDIDEDVFEKLLEVEAEGKPILLFVHIPFYSDHIGNGAKSTLDPPAQYFENCHPVDVWERTPNERTKEFCAYIRRSPLIRCVFSGHIHRSAEVLGLDDMDQIITGWNTIREITVT